MVRIIRLMHIVGFIPMVGRTVAIGGGRLVGIMDRGDSTDLRVVFHQVQDRFRPLRRLHEPFIHVSEAGKD